MHTYVEIELVLDGKCKQLINGLVYDNIERGSLYLLTPVDFHRLFDFESPVSVINLCFDDSFYGSEIVRFFMNKNSNFLLKLSPDEIDAVEKMIERIQEGSSTDDKYSKTYVKNELENFLIFILRKNELEHPEAFKMSLDPMQKVIQYLFLHYGENPTCEEMAKICGYSESYFCRQFKKLTKKTYVEFLTNLKLNYAKIFLLSQNMQIIEIASACGFNSISNFNRIFKQNVGITPSEFIRRNK